MFKHPRNQSDNARSSNHSDSIIDGHCELKKQQDRTKRASDSFEHDSNAKKTRYESQNSTNDSLQVKLRSVWDAIRNQDYTQAMDLSSNFSESEKNEDDYYHVYASILVGKKNYSLALDAALKIKNLKFSQKLFLANCYEKNRMYADAIRVYKNIPRWENNQTVVLGLSINLERNKQYQEALDVLKYCTNETHKVISYASCYTHMGRYQEAIDKYHTIYGWKKKNNVLMGLAFCYRKMGAYENARNMCQMVIPKNDFDALCVIGFCYLEEGREEDAISLFKKLINDHRAHAKNRKSAIEGLVSCYDHLSQYQKVIDTYNEYYSEQERDESCLRRMGHTYLKLGDNEHAKKMFQSIAGWKSNDALSALVVRCDVTSNQSKEAILQTYAQKPQTKALIIIQARFHFSSKNYDLSIQTYKTYPSWETDNDFLLGIARCYEAKEEFNSALELLEKMTNVYDKNRTLALAILHNMMGCYGKAIKTIEAHPSWEQHRELLLARARVSEKMGDYESAVSYFKQIKNYRNDDEVLLGIAIAFFHASQYPNALYYYTKIKCWENNLEIRLAIAKCHQQMGNSTQASEDFGKILAETTNDVKIFIIQSRCYFEQGEHAEALNLLKSIPDQKNIAVISAIIRCYFAMKEYHNAIEIFNTTDASSFDKPMMITWGNCLLQLKKYSLARDKFQSIPGWETDAHILKDLGAVYMQEGDYEQALKIYQSIDAWEKNVTLMINIALCFSYLNNYEASLKILSTIPHAESNIQVQILIANRYLEMNKLDLSISKFEQILDKNLSIDDRRNANIGLVSAYIKKNNYQQAFSVLEPLYQSNPHDLVVLDKLAFCCYKAQLFDRAFDFLNKMPSNIKSASIYAHIYKKQGRFDQAVKLYDEMSVLDSDIGIQLDFARCYMQMGQYDKAIQKLQAIPKIGRTTNSVYQQLGYCYLELQQYELAMSCFQKLTNWQHNAKALFGLFKIHLAKRNFAIAINFLKKIQGWEQDTKMLLALGRCYQTMGQDEQAIKTFRLIADWEHNPEVLFLLALQEERKGFLGRARQLYLNAYEKCPDSYEVTYNCCRFLVKQDDEQASTMLQQALEKWPEEVDLKRLAVYQQGKSQSVQYQLQLLEQFIQRFPYHMQTYLDLIRLNIYIGQVEKAEQYQTHCVERFTGNHVFHKKIQKLLGAKTVIQLWGTDYNTIDANENTEGPIVVVPLENLLPNKVIPDALSFDNNQLPILSNVREIMWNLKHEYYFVGSVVHALIDKTPLKLNQDIDLVMVGECSNVINEQGGFDTSIYKSNLYTQKIDNINVECYVVPPPSVEETFFQRDGFSRDFTITCLYVDSDLNLYDPTGLGVQDYKNKMLRTVKPAAVSFKEDPVRMLRAIKYMLQGFEPSTEIIEAINHWQTNTIPNQSHIQAVARKYIFDLGQHYVDRLIEFGLAEKMFSVKSNSNETTYLLLKQKVARHAVQAVETQIKTKIDEYMTQSQSAWSVKNMPGVIQFCTQALDLNPNFVPALVKRAQAYREERDWQKALSDLDEAISTTNSGSRYNPELAFLFNERGIVYAKSHSLLLARDDFEEAYALSSGAEEQGYKENYEWADAKCNQDLVVKHQRFKFFKSSLPTKPIDALNQTIKLDGI